MKSFRQRHRGVLLGTLLAITVAGIGMPSLADTASDLRAKEIQLRNAMEQSPTDGAIRISLAQVYMQMGNFNAAVAELIVARQLRVKDEVVAPLMAQAMLETGDQSNLLNDIPAGNRTPKVESKVRTYRAIAQMGIGETANALSSLKDAERLDPTNVVAKVATARILMTQKQVQQAEQKIDQALAIAPNDSSALEIKGLLVGLRNDQKGSLAFLGKAIATNPRNVQAILDRANIEANLNQLDLAAKDVAAAKSVAPNLAMIAYVDALVKVKSGKFKEADDALDKLRPIMQNIPGAYFLAGEIKFKLNQASLAEDYLTKFVAQVQDQPEAYELLGVLAMQRGDVSRGIAMLEKAHALAPKDAQAAVLLAQAYMGHGEADKAVTLMDSEAALLPNDKSIVSERALTHFAHGDPGASVSELGSLFKSGNGDQKVGPSLILAQLQAGKTADASQTAQALVKREPDNILYQELLGATFVAQGNNAAAEGVFQRILSKQPGLLAARRSLAQVYLATNRTPQAIKLFQDWIAKNPADLKAKQALAGIYVSQKNYGAGLKLLNDANVLKAGDLSAGIQVVLINEMQHNWADAIAAAKTLQTRFPKDESVMDALGRLYSESGDTKSSLAVYATATAAFPQSAALWNNYATALAASKNMPASLDAIAKAHALAPANIAYERGLVELTYVVKGDAAARAAAQSLTNNSPQNPVSAVLLAGALAKNGKVPDAIAILEAAQVKAPSPQLLALLTRFYLANKQPQRAVVAVEAWVKAHPDDAGAHNELAQLYGSTGNTAKALEQYEWLLVRQPKDPVIMNNVAYLYSQKNDPRARAMAEGAFKLAPKSGSVADTLGWILVGQNDAANGLKYLQMANSESPNDPTLQYHLAVALSKTNNGAAAKPILQKILSSNASPDVKQSAKQLLAKLGG